MKSLVKYFCLLTMITFFSCQKEEEVTTIGANSFTKSSPLASLLSRVCQNPTHSDNVIDGSDCFSVMLPIAITVNGQQVTINSTSDYQLVKNIKSASTTDDDIVYFTYPITIKYRNFQTKIINNVSEFTNEVSQCGNSNNFNEIDCIQFVFPITIKQYDSNNQVSNTVTITSNSHLFNYIESLIENQYIAISFPVAIIDSNSATITLNNNDELSSFIENSIDDCEDVTVVPDDFLTILNSGTWYVSSFYEDEDETYHFVDFRFTFNVGGTISVVKNSVNSTGNWIFENGSQPELELNFQNIELEELNEDWKVLEYNSSTIRLKHESGGSGKSGGESENVDEYLTFTKI